MSLGRQTGVCGRLSGGCGEAFWGCGKTLCRRWGGCLEGVGRLYGGYGEAVWRVGAGFLEQEGVGRISGRCQEVVCSGW